MASLLKSVAWKGAAHRNCAMQAQGGTARLGEIKEEERAQPARGTFAKAGCPVPARTRGPL